ncbi:MAG TPA: hypothetical protein VKR21_12480 [Solirubrobacteraceae bacterium]|nr:hypothetical protein [Solirubrobacteraceae bacterium]
MTTVVGSVALGQTLALLATFGGIGVLANILILYVVGQVFAEHKQNQEHDPGLE